MSNSNDKTIQAYESNVQGYIDTTPQEVPGSLKEWFEVVLYGLLPTARILEFGSASGRDAAYITSLSYHVECTDAAQAFVERLKRQGFNARKLNAITDTLGGPYDLILAVAVLVHFTPDETRQVLKKVFDALAPGGRFAFTVKEGQGEAWKTNKGAPRYFCHWTEQSVRVAAQAAGFEKVEVSPSDEQNGLWLQILAQKQA